MPSIFPFSCGSASDVAFAAPVDAGTMLIAAARARQVLVRQVEQVLVVRVRVHRGHQGPVDPEGSSSTFASGTTQFVVQDAFEIMVRRGVVGVVVHAHHDRDVLALRGRADDDLLGAGFEVGRRLLPVREQTGRLDHDLGADLLPRELRGIALREHTQLVAVDGEAVVRDGDLASRRPRTESYFSRCARVFASVMSLTPTKSTSAPVSLDGAEEVAADPSETVDANLHAHRGEPPRGSLAPRSLHPTSGPRGLSVRAGDVASVAVDVAVVHRDAMPVLRK